jgi:hypothetical protein
VFERKTVNWSQLIVFYIPIFTFLDRRREDKMFRTEWYKKLPEFCLLLISSWMKFFCVTVVPKYLIFATFSKLAIFMSWFCPAFWWRDSNICLVFCAFISRTTSLLASIQVSVLFFMISMLSPNKLKSPAAGVFHLISVQPGWPGPS